MASHALNERQARFVAEYIKDLNASTAAIRAGYSESTAPAMGSRLLKNRKVAAALAVLQEKAQKRSDVTVDRVVRELARIAFGDVRPFFDETGRLLPIHELPDDVAAMLGSFEIAREKTRLKTANNGDEITVEESVVKVKSWDKVRALELLSKHLGMLRERVTVDFDLSALAPDDLVTLEQLLSRLAPVAR